MKHFVLFYDFVPDFRDKRVPHRPAHLDHARASVARGELQLAGAFAEEPAGSMLVFKAESAAVAEDFARADPYVLHGVAAGWRVREWVTVVGEQALTPVT